MSYAQPDLRALFMAVDTDRSGFVDCNELWQLLSQGGYFKFDVSTCKLMIKMFDRAGKGVISFDEFVQLWGYLQQWRGSFASFDSDRSNTIGRDEMFRALQAMGYRFSPQFFDILFYAYDTDRSGSLSFDEFISICAELHILTGFFAAFDTSRTGHATLSYEQFLQGAMLIKC
mmetsp:Transcript_15357/g.49024  ORF Transcript_15357/g.49024 Transcript_15357/m.49024 type:complete len:173 (-) Transcript_15357:111-629(-)